MYLHTCGLLGECLKLNGLEPVVSDGWPQDKALLKEVATIVVYATPAAEYLLDGPHRTEFLELMELGVGLVTIHWASSVVKENYDRLGDRWMSLLGGTWISNVGLSTDTSLLTQLVPQHPICRGWKNYELLDEYYLKPRIAQGEPLLRVTTKGEEVIVGWAYERPDGGRSYATTLGHFYSNFQREPFRRTIVNAMVWTAKMEVPETGARIDVGEGILKLPPENARTLRGNVNVPCRLYVEAADGKSYFARPADQAGSTVVYDVHRGEGSREQHTTLLAGSFLVDLPPGEYTFTAEHGKECETVTKAVQVPAAGDLPEVVLELRRWVDMPSRNWFSGDTHVHRRLEDLPNLMEAEDLHVALPLTYWVRAAYDRPDQAPVAGHPAPEKILVSGLDHTTNRPTPRIIWPINTEYELFTVAGKPHTQGAVFVLNHQTPLRAAAPPAAPVAVAAREQRALLDLDKHSWNWSMMIVPIMNVDLFELANNHVWRTGFLFRNWTQEMLPADWDIEKTAEGYTEAGWIDWGFKTYYALLNCGFRMRPTGGTGAGVHPVPLGFGRVYVECPGGFSYANWISGLNAGRSFVTTGPMLRVQFDGQPAGTVFRDAKPHSIRITGTAEAQRPIQRVEIVVNGEVRLAARKNERVTEEGLAPRFQVTIDEEIPIKHSSWIAVRCFEGAPTEKSRQGAGNADAATGRFRYAHTAPVHVEIDGPVRPRAREVGYFIGRMEQEIARNKGVLAEDEVAEYERALQIYREIARRASP
ncbi:MAG: CehA/McbA family metallohydrolase [Planctomycetales bacterium]